MSFESIVLAKLDELCTRLTRLENQFKNHTDAKQKKLKSRREKISTAIAITTTGIMILSFILNT